MLLHERLKTEQLPGAERQMADYLLEHLDTLAELSSIDLARETYTSPTTAVRLARRLGFSGWSEFKKALKKERAYLNRSFQGIDANYPFSPEDSEERIAASISRLYSEGIEDTMQLVDTRELAKAVDLMEKSSRIVLFALGDLYSMADHFAFQLERIGKNVHLQSYMGMHEHTAWQMKEGECAVLISYSGETPMILDSLSVLKTKGIPVIALTSIGENSLASMADIRLFLSTREKEISKIWSFSSSLSVLLLLDILYSCLFARDYEKNNQLKKEIAAQVETKRQIRNGIISENEQ